jgi:hypothetical protein
MDKDELCNQNVDLQKKLEERNQFLGEYLKKKKKTRAKNCLLQQHQTKLEEALWKLSDVSYQQVNLQQELKHKDVILVCCMKTEIDEVTNYNSHSSQSNGFLLPMAVKGTGDL